MEDRKSGAGDPGEGTPERSGGVPSRSAGEQGSSLPDPEVNARAQRRRFSAEYKLKIVREAAACREPGQIGALLRREGLYASMLADWRRQFEQAGVQALKARKRGPKAKERNPLAGRVTELEKENRKLQRRLAEADEVIDFQKKVHELLGIPLRRRDSDESGS
jgi:transposase-like protein